MGAENNSTVRLILASASPARHAMLTNAGVGVDVQKSDVNEGAVRAVLAADGPAIPDDVARVLAETKAQTVSEQNHDAVVIGADQVLALGDQIWEKPANLAAARDQLLGLSGQTHSLHCAVAMARDGDVFWRYSDTAYVTMRPYSAAFVGQYLAEVGDAACQSVGSYHLEGRGSQLIAKVDGDFFTILGLPLFPVLEQLRLVGVLQH